MGAGTVTVLGATGKTGRAVSVAALRRGLSVRGTSRDGVGLPDGVDPALADLVTGEGLVEAFRGVDAAYLVVPNVHPAEVAVVTRAARAARQVGVARMVYHSVAHPDDVRMPHHLRKGRAEQELHAAWPDVVVLRPCAYQQNLLGAALAGRIEVPYRVDAPFSLVDLADVAEVAAAALAGELRPGTTHELAGPQDLTVLGLAQEAAQVLGRPVAHAATTLSRWRAGAGARLDACAVADLTAMFRAYDESGFTADPAPLARLLGRAPTTWAELLRQTDPSTLRQRRRTDRRTPA